ncbi:MAG: helix-turn-helix transcriptional regulator [Chloroflexota bacterium]|nr:helix-turn-helix transcriptional regulator [Chloroflexota bacterium]
MSDPQVARAFRAVRIRLGKRQQDLADEACVSRQVVSRVECGHLDQVSIAALRSIARVLGIHLDLTARWRGGDLDRMLNRRHAALHEAALEILAGYPGWQFVPEVSFNVWGERGVIDLVGWNEQHRALAFGELKSEFVDPGELVGTMDRRQRLAVAIAESRGWKPLVVGMWVIAADTRTNRRHLAASRRLLRSAFPADGHAMARWLTKPTTSIAGLSFVSVPRVAGEGKRVRRPRVRPQRADPADE